MPTKDLDEVGDRGGNQFGGRRHGKTWDRSARMSPPSPATWRGFRAGEGELPLTPKMLPLADRSSQASQGPPMILTSRRGVLSAADGPHEAADTRD